MSLLDWLFLVKIDQCEESPEEDLCRNNLTALYYIHYTSKQKRNLISIVG